MSFCQLRKQPVKFRKDRGLAADEIDQSGFRKIRADRLKPLLRRVIQLARAVRVRHGDPAVFARSFRVRVKIAEPRDIDLRRCQLHECSASSVFMAIASRTATASCVTTALCARTAQALRTDSTISAVLVEYRR